MASCSEIEGWLATLGTGLAGLRILREYGIRTSELEYFIENLNGAKIEVSAFAPKPLRNQYEPVVAQAEARLRSGVEKITSTNVSKEVMDEVLRDARQLYSLLSDIHKAAISGFIIV